MRQTKFRAWDKKSKKMLIDGFIIYYTGVAIKYLDVRHSSIDELIVMEWTGKKDRNGKDIFEGDIVDNGFKFAPSKGVVKFWEASFRVAPLEGSGIFSLGMTGQMCSGKMKVIGNIYENSNLLEKKCKEK